MGSKMFQAYVANLQRLSLAQLVDDQLLATQRWPLSIVARPIRVIRCADDYREGFQPHIWTR